jgi:hypothetical protein
MSLEAARRSRLRLARSDRRRVEAPGKCRRRPPPAGKTDRRSGGKRGTAGSARTAARSARRPARARARHGHATHGWRTGRRTRTSCAALPAARPAETRRRGRQATPRTRRRSVIAAPASSAALRSWTRPIAACSSVSRYRRHKSRPRVAVVLAPPLEPKVAVQVRASWKPIPPARSPDQTSAAAAVQLLAATVEVLDESGCAATGAPPAACGTRLPRRRSSSARLRPAPPPRSPPLRP